MHQCWKKYGRAKEGRVEPHSAIIEPHHADSGLLPRYVSSVGFLHCPVPSSHAWGFPIMF